MNKGTGSFTYLVPHYGFDEHVFKDMADFKGSGNATPPQLNGWSYSSGQLTSTKPAYLIWNFSVNHPITRVDIKYQSSDHQDYGERVSISKDNRTWDEIFNNDRLGGVKGVNTHKELTTYLVNNGTYFFLKIENNSRKHVTLNYLNVLFLLDLGTLHHILHGVLPERV